MYVTDLSDKCKVNYLQAFKSLRLPLGDKVCQLATTKRIIDVGNPSTRHTEAYVQHWTTFTHLLWLNTKGENYNLYLLL